MVTTGESTHSRYDVAVVGGGIAGVSAALSAARSGAKTCLIEKSCLLGGLATRGNVVVYLPICDGEGHQVIGGLGEELLLLAAADGYDAVPEVWSNPHSSTDRSQERYAVRFNAPSYMLALEKTLVDAGVSIWYDTLFLDVTVSNNIIQNVIVHNKSGRLEIETKMVIDATGDADVCYASGEDTIELDTNVRSNWFFYYDDRGVHLVGLSEGFTEDGTPAESVERGYSGVVGRDISAHVLDSHQLLRDRFMKIKEQSPEAHLVNIASMPSFRMTRRLQSDVVLSEAMSGKTPDDLVGLCPSWRTSGVVYGIPFRSLCGTQVNNLLAAGRCISASGRLWDLTRVIPVCALTGEIAGTAAGMVVKTKAENLHSLAIKELRQQLLTQQNILDGSLIRGV